MAIYAGQIRQIGKNGIGIAFECSVARPLGIRASTKAGGHWACSSAVAPFDYGGIDKLGRCYGYSFIDQDTGNLLDIAHAQHVLHKQIFQTASAACRKVSELLGRCCIRQITADGFVDFFALDINITVSQRHDFAGYGRPQRPGTGVSGECPGEFGRTTRTVPRVHAARARNRALDSQLSGGSKRPVPGDNCLSGCNHTRHIAPLWPVCRRLRPLKALGHALISPKVPEGLKQRPVLIGRPISTAAVPLHKATSYRY